MPSDRSQKNFIFCVHAHQPVGNFGGVFEEAVDKCYTPFFDVVENHPKMPVVFHLSGSLIDWLESNRPDFLRRLQGLTRTHEIEILGGAYYEPIYGLIPKRDLLGQIGRMQKKIENLFGTPPSGAWLTERVWDPELVEALSQAGVAYTVLDDAHFKTEGMEAPVTGYYTANGGPHAVDLFASMKALRYQIPFRPARDAVRYIRSLKVGPERAVVFADDLEKFGFWPGTARWVYGEKWLDRFFTLIENEPHIRATTFRSFRESFAPVRKVHIPHGSYEEMTEWSGGGFYNFFEKYPESRYMKERMLQVSEQVASGAATEESKTALYRAQCNCSYWHGIFGGLYLHHLRSSVFENLLKAEKPAAATECRMLLFDSGRRWHLRQKKLASYFNPDYGASLEELDFLPKSVNLLCTLQRRPEPYHRFVFPNGAGVKSSSVLSIHQLLGVKDPNLKSKLSYDPYRKLSFLDHFFEKAIDLESFSLNRYEEAGDFTDGRYEGAMEETPSGPKLVFERSGSVRALARDHRVRLQKTVTPKGEDGLRVEYRITNESAWPLSAAWAVEFNFSIGQQPLGDGRSGELVRECLLRDPWKGIEIRLASEPAVVVTTCPVETVSESEGGMEGTYQQTAMLVQRHLEIAPGMTECHAFELEVR